MTEKEEIEFLQGQLDMTRALLVYLVKNVLSQLNLEPPLLKQLPEDVLAKLNIGSGETISDAKLDGITQFSEKFVAELVD